MAHRRSSQSPALGALQLAQALSEFARRSSVVRLTQQPKGKAAAGDYVGVCGLYAIHGASSMSAASAVAASAFDLPVEVVLIAAALGLGAGVYLGYHAVEAGTRVEVDVRALRGTAPPLQPA
jgi:hypothetical protein